MKVRIAKQYHSTNYLYSINMVPPPFRPLSRHAFEQLYEQHYFGLVAYALKFLDSKSQSEETVSDLFCQFWENRHQYEIKTSYKSYLTTALKNKCLDVLRKEKVRRAYTENFTKQHSSGFVENQIHFEELERQIARCLEQLPPKRREIFMLSREHGMKYREIAEKLNISIKTVETHIARSLKFLRRELVEYI